MTDVRGTKSLFKITVRSMSKRKLIFDDILYDISPNQTQTHLDHFKVLDKLLGKISIGLDKDEKMSRIPLL